MRKKLPLILAYVFLGIIFLGGIVAHIVLPR